MSKISGLMELDTGTVYGVLFVGVDSEGRRLVSFCDGYQPVSSDGRQLYPEQNGDGCWVEGTECKPYAFE